MPYETAQSNLSSQNFGGLETSDVGEQFGKIFTDPIGWFRGRILGDDAHRTQTDMINNLNRQWALEDWYRSAEWNSEAARVQRLRDAGLNEHLAYGGTSGSMSPNTPTGSVANISGGKPAQMMGILESFLRLRQGFASLRTIDLKNDLLEAQMPDLINEPASKQGLRAVQMLNGRERAKAQQITNGFLNDMLQTSLDKNKISIDMLEDQYSVERFNLYTGVYNAVAELKSYGMSDENIYKCLNMSGLDFKVFGGRKGDGFNDKGLKEWHDAERGLDIEERNAAMSEATMSAILSSMGLHEGDPTYQRMMAVASRVGAAGVSAAAYTDKILDTAARIFGTVQGAVGNAVRNSYVRRMTRRAGYVETGSTRHIYNDGNLIQTDKMFDFLE